MRRAMSGRMWTRDDSPARAGVAPNALTVPVPRAAVPAEAVGRGRREQGAEARPEDDDDQ